MNGRFVVSTAGHDAGKVYIIVGTDRGLLLLADGVERTIANPKKKNPKHVEMLHPEYSEGIDELISAKARGCNEAIRQRIHHLIKDNLRYK